MYHVPVQCYSFFSSGKYFCHNKGQIKECIRNVSIVKIAWIFPPFNLSICQISFYIYSSPTWTLFQHYFPQESRRLTRMGSCHWGCLENLCQVKKKKIVIPIFMLKATVASFSQATNGQHRGFLEEKASKRGRYRRLAAQQVWSSLATFSTSL